MAGSEHQKYATSRDDRTTQCDTKKLTPLDDDHYKKQANAGRLSLTT